MLLRCRLNRPENEFSGLLIHWELFPAIRELLVRFGVLLFALSGADIALLAFATLGLLLLSALTTLVLGRIPMLLTDICRFVVEVALRLFRHHEFSC